MITKWMIGVALTASLIITAPLNIAYPIDGYEDTGIRRVEGYRRITAGEIPGIKLPQGGRLNTAAVDLRLTQQMQSGLPVVDQQLSQEIKQLLGKDAAHYGLALLDYSDPNNMVYAEVNADYRQNVGSVGKLDGALGFFHALADVYPTDIDKRAALLKSPIFTADQFSQRDTHSIKVFDPATNIMHRHSMKIGETGNLWEYLDWMLSVSSNAAAAMIMREAMLIRHFKTAYPVDDSQIQAFFRDTDKATLTALYKETFWQPIERNGISIDELRQGSFFTRSGKAAVYGGGLSYGTAKSLMQLTLKMEQGQLVDRWSSLQLKRLLYMTERRIRYASAPALNAAAVYFKSGSLYSCKTEPGFSCGKYQGNVKNYMNSLAIIESPAAKPELQYSVALISNVLKVNSAVAHQTLAMRIHRLLEKRHAGQSTTVAKSL